MSNPMRFVRPRAPSQDLPTSSRQRKANQRIRELAVRGTVPPFAWIVDPDNLLWVYDACKRHGGQAPGPDGLTYDTLSAKEAPAIFRSVSENLLQGTYQPGPSRTVLIPKVNSPKLRKLTLRSIVDRVVSATVNDALRLIWERKFLPGSYGFRPNRSVQSLLVWLETTMLEKQRFVLAIDDVQDAFPSVVIDDVVADHAQDIGDGDQELLKLIDTILRGGDLARKIGIDQGSPYSPTALNVRLHYAHDLRIAPQTPYWAWFADNLVYLVQNVSEGQKVLEESNSILNREGFRLKSQDGPPIDLRKGTAQLLGFTLSVKDGRLCLDLGKEAWEKLRQNLLQGHLAIDPTSFTRSVVDGWIGAYGPAFENRQNVLSRVIRIASELGFRESYSLGALDQKAVTAFQRWQFFRRAALRNVESVVASGMVMAPPITTAVGG